MKFQHYIDSILFLLGYEKATYEVSLEKEADIWSDHLLFYDHILYNSNNLFCVWLVSWKTWFLATCIADLLSHNIIVRPCWKLLLWFYPDHLTYSTSYCSIHLSSLRCHITIQTFIVWTKKAKRKSHKFSPQSVSLWYHLSPKNCTLLRIALHTSWITPWVFFLSQLFLTINSWTKRTICINHVGLFTFTWDVTVS